MHIIVLNNDTFDVIDMTGVKSIAYASGNYTITKSDNTSVTYSDSTYSVKIL